MEFSHYSVMLKETIEELKVKSDGIYVDGTLGGGGHAYEVCKRLCGCGTFLGIVRMRQPLRQRHRDSQNLEIV